MKFSANAKNAIKIGAMCFLSYLAVYLARNVLSTVTPQMQAQGFTKADIGVASSLYFITYAFGQLINGRLGAFFGYKRFMIVGINLALEHFFCQSGRNVYNLFLYCFANALAL